MPSGLIGQVRHRHSQMTSSHSAKGGTGSSNPVPSTDESSGLDEKGKAKVIPPDTDAALLQQAREAVTLCRETVEGPP